MAGEEMKRMYYGYQNGVAVGQPDSSLVAFSPSKRREGLRPLRPSSSMGPQWAPSKPPASPQQAPTLYLDSTPYRPNNAQVLHINPTFCISKAIPVSSSISTVLLSNFISYELVN